MEIFCFGDSHSRYFKKSNMMGWSGVLTPSSPKITAFDYVAASAKGFAAGEKSRFAYKKFMRDVTEKAPDFICLAYGQVDAEVGYYYRKYVAGSTASPEADLSAVYEAYVAMAGQVLPGRKLVFKGLNPSTLRNETQLVTYAYRRLTARMTDEGERQALADVLANAGLTVAAHAGINRMANEILAQKARAAGHGFFDIRDTAGDPAHQGLAAWCYVPAESDVHLTDCFEIRAAYQTKLFAAFDALYGRSKAD